VSGEKVVAMPGFALPTPKGEAVEGMVAILEQYLENAKSGILVGVAIAGVLDDGTVSGLSSTSFKAAIGRAAHLESSLSRLNRRYGAWMDE
jgi:hypothetical protein